MKQTENYQQLYERFTKRLNQITKKRDELTDQPEEWLKVDAQVHYLNGCKDTVEYLLTGQLPKDGNHDGMKNHVPRSDA